VRCDPLDRIDHRPHTAITHRLIAPSFPSDHVPVRTVFRCPPSSAPRIPTIPRWVSCHPQFMTESAFVLNETGDVDEGIASLCVLKECLYLTALRLKNEARPERSAYHC
jgi:hypothetical protein